MEIWTDRARICVRNQTCKQHHCKLQLTYYVRAKQFTLERGAGISEKSDLRQNNPGITQEGQCKV